MLFKVIIWNIYLSGISCYIICKVLLNILAHMKVKKLHLLFQLNLLVILPYILHFDCTEAYLFIFTIWESVDKTFISDEVKDFFPLKTENVKSSKTKQECYVMLFWHNMNEHLHFSEKIYHICVHNALDLGSALWVPSWLA